MESFTSCYKKSVKCLSVKCSSTKLFVLYILLFRTVLCENFCPKFAERPLETRVQDATIVFRAVVVQSHLETRTLDLALVSIYHGGLELATISQYGGSPYNTTDRQVNLKIRHSLVSCFSWGEDQLQKELVVFSRISDPVEDLHTTPPNGPWLEATSSAVPWSLGVDIAIWNAVGWADWGEWSPCSRTCGGGSQSLRRYCLKPPCEGFSEQTRKCNIFSCEGAVDPLAPTARRNFHPAQAKWKALADRPHAYSLRPNSYIWISSSELFPETNAFPNEFTLFVSLRLRPESGGHGQGTLFSLRSRRKSGAFLSLELAGRGVARLMHAGAGSSRAIYLVVPLYDFRWHQIAISVHDDRSVRIFVDCHWLRTDVLEKDALETPRDADLIIGYLFSGDLEQLVVVPEATVASEQCSSQISSATTSILNGIVEIT